MKHRMIPLILIAALLFTLAGCTLAVTEGGVEGAKDRLVGIYVTTEPLDSAPSDGQRLYAETVKTPWTDDEGKSHDFFEYDLPGEGAALYFTVWEGTGDDRHTASHSDDAVQDIFHEIRVAGYDGSQETNVLTGTVFVAPGEGDRVLYFNPVYQPEDGQVYVTAESGFGFSIGAGNQCEGEVYGHELSETTTITVDGKEVETGSTIKVTVSVMFAPKSVTVFQFDSHGAVLRKTTWQAGQAPDQIVLETDTAYLIVETVKANPAGGTVATREVLDRDAETLSAYHVREDGLCAAQAVDLVWPDEEGGTP